MQLSDKEFQIIQSILKSLIPDAEIWLFGSRVKNQSAKYSDIDILAKMQKPIPLDVLFKLKNAFDESDLPFTVDIVDWHRVSPEFRNLILNDAKTFKK